MRQGNQARDSPRSSRASKRARGCSSRRRARMWRDACDWKSQADPRSLLEADWPRQQRMTRQVECRGVTSCPSRPQPTPSPPDTAAAPTPPRPTPQAAPPHPPPAGSSATRSATGNPASRRTVPRLRCPSYSQTISPPPSSARFTVSIITLGLSQRTRDGNPRAYAVLDVVPGGRREDLHRERHLEQDVPLAPVDGCVEVQPRAACAQRNALRVAAVQHAPLDLQRRAPPSRAQPSTSGRRSTRRCPTHPSSAAGPRTPGTGSPPHGAAASQGPRPYRRCGRCRRLRSTRSAKRRFRAGRA